MPPKKTRKPQTGEEKPALSGGEDVDQNEEAVETKGEEDGHQKETNKGKKATYDLRRKKSVKFSESNEQVESPPRKGRKSLAPRKKKGEGVVNQPTTPLKKKAMPPKTPRKTTIKKTILNSSDANKESEDGADGGEEKEDDSFQREWKEFNAKHNTDYSPMKWLEVLEKRQKLQKRSKSDDEGEPGEAADIRRQPTKPPPQKAQRSLFDDIDHQDSRRIMSNQVGRQPERNTASNNSVGATRMFGSLQNEKSAIARSRGLTRQDFAIFDSPAKPATPKCPVGELITLSPGIQPTSNLTGGNEAPNGLPSTILTLVCLSSEEGCSKQNVIQVLSDIFGELPRDNEVELMENHSSYHGDMARVSFRIANRIATRLEPHLRTDFDGHVITKGNDNSDAVQAGFLLQLVLELNSKFPNSHVRMKNGKLILNDRALPIKELFTQTCIKPSAIAVYRKYSKYGRRIIFQLSGVSRNDWFE